MAASLRTGPGIRFPWTSLHLNRSSPLRAADDGAAVGTGLLAPPQLLGTAATPERAILLTLEWVIPAEIPALSQHSETLQRSMGFPRGKERDTGFTRVCAAAELLLTQSAPSALQVVSLGLYSHYLINPSDSLILQSRNAFPPDRLLLSQGAGQPGERGAGGGAGWARCQAQGQPQPGLPGSQAPLPVCSGFRHSLIRTFLWVLHRIQLFLYQLREM